MSQTFTKENPPVLPPGSKWHAVFDDEYQQYFFVNLDTNQSQWEAPPGTTSVQAAAVGRPKQPPQQQQYQQQYSQQQYSQQQYSQQQYSQQQYQQQQYQQQQYQQQNTQQSQQQPGKKSGFPTNTAVGVAGGLLGAMLLKNAFSGPGGRRSHHPGCPPPPRRGGRGRHGGW